MVGYHKGAYEQIQDSFKRIREWGQNLDLEDGILAVNIIDQFVEQNNENYATRIEVKLQIHIKCFDLYRKAGIIMAVKFIMEIFYLHRLQTGWKFMKTTIL